MCYYCYCLRPTQKILVLSIQLYSVLYFSSFIGYWTLLSSFLLTDISVGQMQGKSWHKQNKQKCNLISWVIPIFFTDKPISWIIFLSFWLGVYLPVCFSLRKGEMKSRSFLLCFCLSPRHKGPHILETQAARASTTRGRAVGAAPASRYA